MKNKLENTDMKITSRSLVSNFLTGLFVLLAMMLTSDFSGDQLFAATFQEAPPVEKQEEDKRKDKDIEKDSLEKASDDDKRAKPQQEQPAEDSKPEKNEPQIAKHAASATPPISSQRRADERAMVTKATIAGKIRLLGIVSYPVIGSACESPRRFEALLESSARLDREERAGRDSEMFAKPMPYLRPDPV